MRFGIPLFGGMLFFLSCQQNTDKKAIDPLTVMSKPDSALAVLDQRIEANPRDPVLFHERAKVYLAKKDLAAAFTDMKTALDMDSTKAEFFLTLADLYLISGKSGNSKASLEKSISLDPANSAAKLKLAELFMLVRKYDQAMKYLDDVLRSDVHNAKAYFIKGMCFKELGDTSKAVSSFRTAIDQNTDYYEAFMQLGVLMTLKHEKIALQYFNSALALRPQSVEAYYGRSMFYQETGDFNKAIEGYTMLTTVDPKNKNAHFNLGYIHQEYLKVYDEALKHYTRAIAADSAYFEAWYNRGLCYESLGNIQAAKSDFQKAAAINPEYTPAKGGLSRLGQ